jgi:pimeloyl-ACP methyl ester carboxylesterase
MNWSRHFVSLGGYGLHYRRMGQGPAVMGFHGSPQASLAIEGFARAAVAQGLSVIAPDTPGNGLSEALPGIDPEATDYAQKMLALADYLGLGRFGLYGFHTGAGTALVMSTLAPDRIAALACDGLPAWTPDERQELMAGYLPHFMPTFDGGHMAWLWARIEEQTMFFPWHVTKPENRMVYDMPPVAGLHANAMDFLDAGDAYRAPYRAAFAFRVDQFIDKVSAPLFIACTSTDPLRFHLDRSALAARQPQTFTTGPELVQAAAAFLAKHPGDVPPRTVASSAADRFGRMRGVIETCAQPIGWTGSLTGSGRPLVFIHDAGGSSRWAHQAIDLIAGKRPAISLDLPGHGLAAGPAQNSFPEIGALIQQIKDATATMGLDQPLFIGRGAGGLLALVLGGIAVDPPSDDPALRAEILAHGFPSLAPEWDGAHLVRAFRIARFEQLYNPWFKRDRHHRIFDGDLSPMAIHNRAIDLLHAQAHARQYAATIFATATPQASKILAGRVLAGQDWWREISELG